MPVEGGTGTAVMSPAANTLRDEMVVSGQRLLAASGQISIAAHTVERVAVMELSFAVWEAYLRVP